MDTAEKNFQEWITRNPRNKTAKRVDKIIKKYDLFANQNEQEKNKNPANAG